MNLLLDLGNSRLKWAFADDKLGTVHSRAWAVPGAVDGLRAEWNSSAPPARVLVASVAPPSCRERIAALLAQLAWPQGEWLRSPARMGRLRNAYSVPADLGIDRFLAMLAALDENQAPCVIASCGTALTLDALQADGRHLGGQIAPGIQAMLTGLGRAAPGLPDPGPGTCDAFAHATSDAMRAGVWQASAAAIERFADLAAQRMQVMPRLLLCGGNAAATASLLRRTHEPFEHAVLRGLHAWLRLLG